VNQVTISEVKRLVRIQDDPAVSIYMTTTAPVRGERGGREDLARLGELLRGASRQLGPRESRRRVDELLAPIVERARAGWRDARGVAFLQSANVSAAFTLPVEVPDLAVVAPAFHTKPLVALLDGGGRFVVLAIADGAATAYEGSPHGLRRMAFSFPARGTSPLADWLCAVDRALGAELSDRGDPVVVAGDGERREAFAAVSAYPWLLDGDLECDLEQVSVPDLHSTAMAIVDAHRAHVEGEAVAQYLAATARGGSTSTDLELLCRGAAVGRVGLLLHRRGAHVWGRVSPSGECSRRSGAQRAGDGDVVDDLCQMVLVSGGNVVEVSPERMPCDGPVCAVLAERVAVLARPQRDDRWGARLSSPVTELRTSELR